MSALSGDLDPDSQDQATALPNVQALYGTPQAPGKRKKVQAKKVSKPSSKSSGKTSGKTTQKKPSKYKPSAAMPSAAMSPLFGQQ